MQEYCWYCKARIQDFDKVKQTEKGLIHNNDEKDCYALNYDENGELLDEE